MDGMHRRPGNPKVPRRWPTVVYAMAAASFFARIAMGVHGSEVALTWVAALSFTLLVALGLYDRGRHLRNDARSGTPS